MKTLEPVLIPTEADRFARGPQRVAHLSRVARHALSLSAARSGAELGALDKDDNDAPLPSRGWHWSISHTETWAGGVVAATAVGLDLEPVAPVSQDVVGEVTSRDELDLFDGFSWHAFARLWTAKEAVLKKAGCGLLELSQCRLIAVPSPHALVLRHRDREHYVHQSFAHDHVGSIAIDAASELTVDWTWEPVAAR